MSTQKDLTELLAYAVKRAETATEIKVAWVGLSKLEKILAKKADENGRMVSLPAIRKIASLIEKQPVGAEVKPAKRDFASYQFKKKDMSKKACSAGCKCSKCKGKKMKKSASCLKMAGMLKKAAQRNLFPGLAKKADPGHANSYELTPGGARSAASIWEEPSASRFMSKAWGKTPGWGKALAALAGVGLLGHGMYSAGREWSKRYDPGVDPEAKGIGLNRDLANALREQMAKAQASSAELGGLQRGWRNAYAPLYGL